MSWLDYKTLNVSMSAEWINNDYDSPAAYVSLYSLIFIVILIFVILLVNEERSNNDL